MKKVIYVQIDAAEHERLRDLAYEQRTSLSALVRQIVRDYAAAQEAS